MAKIDVLDINGKKVDSITLNDDVFAITPNEQALFDAVMLQRANVRQGTHSVKNRSAVSGGGRKPWRQKGTGGRARQGTIRAPQWRGGGVVFGPTPRKYTLKMNKKVRRLALKSALSTKLINGDVIVIDNLNLTTPKTKEFVQVVNNLNIDRKGLFVTANIDENVYLATRNVNNILVQEPSEINVLDLLNVNKLVLTVDAVNKIEEVLG